MNRYNSSQTLRLLNKVLPKRECLIQILINNKTRVKEDLKKWYKIKGKILLSFQRKKLALK